MKKYDYITVNPNGVPPLLVWFVIISSIFLVSGYCLLLQKPALQEASWKAFNKYESTNSFPHWVAMNAEQSSLCNCSNCIYRIFSISKVNK